MARARGLDWAAIDLLRCCAALLVMLYHYGTVLGSGASPHTRGFAGIATLPVEWRQWSWFGWVGVELFFVISGCVIAGSARGTAPGVFLLKRARRLVPAALLCASVTALLLATLGLPAGLLAGEWAASVAFWPVAPWIDQSYWTLGIEWIFYLLVAAMLTRPVGVRHLERAAWVLGAISLAFWIALLAGFGPPELRLARWPQLLLLAHGGCFAMGIFLRGALDEGMTRRRAAGMLLGGAAAALDIVAKSAGEVRGLGIAGGEWLPLAIFAAGIGVLLCANRVQPWLAHAPRGWLSAAAAATYPLYLLHQEAGSVIFLWAQHAGLSPVAAILLASALVLLAAFYVALRLEPPLRRWGEARALSVRHVLRRDIRSSASPSAG